MLSKCIGGFGGLSDCLVRFGASIVAGGLTYNTTTGDLKQAFRDFGDILDAIVIHDRDTGRSSGFGFVTFGSESEAQNAISGLNEQNLNGRRIRVNLADARPSGRGGRYNRCYNRGGNGGGY